MGILLRVFSVIAVLIAAFLVYVVIDVATGSADLREGIAVLYIGGAAVLTALAVLAWRKAGRGGTAAPQV